MKIFRCLYIQNKNGTYVKVFYKILDIHEPIDRLLFSNRSLRTGSLEDIVIF